MRECVFEEPRPVKRPKLGDATALDDPAIRRKSDGSHALSAGQTSAHNHSLLNDHCAPRPDSDHSDTFAPVVEREKPMASTENINRDMQEAATGLTDSVMRTVVSKGNDALQILFEAGTQQQEPNTTGKDHVEEVHNVVTTPVSVHSMTGPSAQSKILQVSSTTPEVLRVWNACRFVRQGWITAEEAVTLFDL